MEKLKQTTVPEFLANARLKLARGRERFTVYVPPTRIPPFKPYKVQEVVDEVVGVKYRVYTRPSQRDGGWLITVNVVREAFNTIPIGEALQRK